MYTYTTIHCAKYCSLWFKQTDNVIFRPLAGTAKRPRARPAQPVSCTTMESVMKARVEHNELQVFATLEVSM